MILADMIRGLPSTWRDFLFYVVSALPTVVLVLCGFGAYIAIKFVKRFRAR